MVETCGKTFAKRWTTSHFRGELGAGPAAYTLEHDAKIRSCSLQYSFGRTLEDVAFKQGNASPGPAEYSLQNAPPLNHTNLLYSFGSEERGKRNP